MLHFTLLVGKPCKRKVEGEDIAREDKKVDREVWRKERRELKGSGGFWKNDGDKSELDASWGTWSVEEAIKSSWQLGYSRLEWQNKHESNRTWKASLVRQGRNPMKFGIYGSNGFDTFYIFIVCLHSLTTFHTTYLKSLIFPLLFIFWPFTPPWSRE